MKTKKLILRGFLCLMVVSLSMNVFAQKPKSEGPFQPTDESFKNYKYPDWFRDAKFGIWAHWGPSTPMSLSMTVSTRVGTAVRRIMLKPLRPRVEP